MFVRNSPNNNWPRLSPRSRRFLNARMASKRCRNDVDLKPNWFDSTRRLRRQNTVRLGINAPTVIPVPAAKYSRRSSVSKTRKSSSRDQRGSVRDRRCEGLALASPRPHRRKEIRALIQLRSRRAAKRSHPQFACVANGSVPLEAWTLRQLGHDQLRPSRRLSMLAKASVCLRSKYSAA